MSREPAQSNQNRGLRQIPSVEKLLSGSELSSLIDAHGRETVKKVVVERLAGIRSSPPRDFSLAETVDAVKAALTEQARPSLRPLINGTGVLIHTNLGRSPIASALLRDASAVVTRYSNLEFDPGTGSRGKRDHHLETIASRLFGCESAILTNNNASAVLLVLAAIASKREVLVSRGELVEIGGAFRIPDVIEQGGAKLREVGTTNRTRKSDYELAAKKKVAAILHVHQSNFQIVGFTEAPSVGELVEVARRKKIPLVIDEGSGRVRDISRYGFASQPTLRQLIDAGAAVVTCSTDKLIGATQGGLILGSKEILDRCAKHPLMRALRAGKESYAIVAETLSAFLAGKEEERVALYQMLARTAGELKARAEKIAADVGADVIETRSALGGGTTPTETIPSFGVSPRGNASEIRSRMLSNDPPIVGTIQSERYQIDLRTVFADEDEVVITAIASLRA